MCRFPIILWKYKGSVFHSQPRDVVAHPICVGCGQCIECRLKRSREWAVRCMQEKRFHKESSFITLTYSDENLPANRSLCLRDLQLFFKRLRKKLGKKIKYLACGEYGETTERPHYHAIVFGHSFDDKKKVTKKVNEKISQYYESKLLTDTWGLGLCSVGDVTFDSCAYVARYCMKKVSGPSAEEHYGERQKEFIVMSRRPALGKEYLDTYKNNIFEVGNCIFKNHEVSIPRYYRKKLKESLDDYDRNLLKSYEESLKHNEYIHEEAKRRYEVAKYKASQKKRKN